MQGRLIPLCLVAAMMHGVEEEIRMCGQEKRQEPVLEAMDKLILEDCRLGINASRDVPTEGYVGEGGCC